jgi:hypothetical protein
MCSSWDENADLGQEPGTLTGRACLSSSSFDPRVPGDVDWDYSTLKYFIFYLEMAQNSGEDSSYEWSSQESEASRRYFI